MTAVLMAFGSIFRRGLMKYYKYRTEGQFIENN
jgi:hypothetical protein